MHTSEGPNNLLLRKSMRRQRSKLTAQEQRSAAFGLASSARRAKAIRAARRVLSYAPFAGEISPKQIFFSADTQIYLPRITHYRLAQMRFYRQTAGRVNRLGINEPAPVSKPLNANAFDVILLPLVAFDRSGNRLGMGAGFYDRALASLAHQGSTRPTLLGLAHHFQEVNSLSSAPWDVPLDVILTDRELIEVN